jgi:hypothetical protein
MEVDRGFYRDRIPERIRCMEEKDLVVKWKKELKPYLSDNLIQTRLI